MKKNIIPKYCRVDHLSFDHKNSHLKGCGVRSVSNESLVIQALWEAMDVKGLVESIAAGGFFKHEPLIVSKEEGRNVVIEGNRRLAALKILLRPAFGKDQAWDVPKISSEARRGLEEVPIIFSKREDAWRFLGFKHINGPVKWTSYAKAMYIADVHREFGVSLEDIARQIGDRCSTALRLYRGLMVLEQAERARVFNREDCYGPRICFSHLFIALDYEDGVGNFLQVSPKKIGAKSPVPKNKEKELGELCVWLFGSKKAKRSPIVVKQNTHLPMLNSVLSNRESLAALRSGVDLEEAFEISRPPANVFEEALYAAKREFGIASRYFATGYAKSEELMRTAGIIATMAENLRGQMHRRNIAN